MEERLNKLNSDIEAKTKLVKEQKKAGNISRAFKLYQEIDAMKKERTLIQNFNKIK